LNRNLILKINQIHENYLEKQDSISIINFYRDFFQNNHHTSQLDIKKIYNFPEKIKIPFKNEKHNFDFIKVNSSSSLYFFNGNSIYLTGRITHYIPILKSKFIKLVETEQEEEKTLNPKIKEYNKVDVLNSLNELKNNEFKYSASNLNKLKDGKTNIYNNYNFVFILNDENFIIFYEPQIQTDPSLNSNIEKSKSFDDISSSKIQSKVLKIEFVSITENENNELEEVFIPDEKMMLHIDQREFEDSNRFKNDINIQNPSVNQNIREYSNFYNSNNGKIQISYNENEKNQMFDDKFSNFSSNLITAGNIENYYNEYFLSQKEDKVSLDEEYSKELFTEDAANDEIFDKSFNFEQSIEELRNYINLVGISLLE